ncbi:uncharacterized protein C8A04DRAFT_25574 [Dichotomopilus funicola]|uniref:Uncharacterized protein n=1 Tax=Dichotomopilus funicola TaxID=1934379 RepID=A0AAN6V8B7_9PEZI|nr:hypothetical protein C8A04DRAFT_25574 [Dichotomopilus funicola]
MFNTFNPPPNPWPKPPLQPLPFWQRAVCDCHYFYQFFLCGCPDHPFDPTTTTGTNPNNTNPHLPSTHTPNFRPCAIAQAPKIDQLRHLLTGFRHNRTPPIRREPSILPFPCFRHLQEARQYLPPAALRGARKRLLDPKWNPVGVRRLNENYRGMVRFMGGVGYGRGTQGGLEEEEGVEEVEMEVEGGKSGKRVTFWDLEDSDEPQQRQQRQRVHRIVGEKRKRDEEKGWSSGEKDWGSILRPRSRRRSSTSDPGSGSGSTDYDEFSINELDPSTDMEGFHEQFQKRLAQLEAQRQNTVRQFGIDDSDLDFPPPSQPVSLDSPRDNAWMFDTEPMVTDHHSAMSTPSPSHIQNQDLLDSPPPPAYRTPPPAYRRTPPATRSHSRNQSTTTIFPGPNTHRGVSKPSKLSSSHTSSAARHKAATTNPFQALAWLVEEQTADLSQQDGYRWHCNLPRAQSNTAGYYPDPYPYPSPQDPQTTNNETEKITHYDTSSHTGYHTGAYRLDDSVLHQARLAQWAGANPGPGVYAGVIPDGSPPYNSLTNSAITANPTGFWSGYKQAGFNNIATTNDRNVNSGPPVWAGGSCANAFCQRERVGWGGSKARCCPLCPNWRVNVGFVRGDALDGGCPFGGYGYGSYGAYNSYNPSIQPTYNSAHYRHTKSGPSDYYSLYQDQNFNYNNHNPNQSFNYNNNPYQQYTHPSNNPNTYTDHTHTSNNNNTIHPAAASSWGMIMAERVRQIWEEFVSGWSSTTSPEGSPRLGDGQGGGQREGGSRGGWWGWNGGWLSM